MSKEDTFDYRRGFFNLKDVITSMIEGVFDNMFLRRDETKALRFTYRLMTDRHAVSITLYAPSNYVKVIEGITKNGGETWTYRCLSDHDSCWREDGVRQFVSHWCEQMEYLNFPQGVIVQAVDDTMRSEFRKMSNDRDYVYVVKSPY